MTHKIVRLILFSACATVLSMYTAGAASCTSYDGDSLATLITGSVSCTYGGLTFSDFGYSGASTSGNGTPVPSTVITVDAITNMYGVGFGFTADWASGNPAPGPTPSYTDGDITFEVSTGNGAATIEDAGLSQTSGVLGNGFANVSEGICAGAGCSVGTFAIETFEGGDYTSGLCTAEGGTFSGGTCTLLDTDKVFTATGTVMVSKDIDANSGTAGNANITYVADTFSVVPEPRALPILLGLGLVAGLFLRKKFQSVSA